MKIYPDKYELILYKQGILQMLPSFIRSVEDVLGEDKDFHFFKLGFYIDKYRQFKDCSDEKLVALLEILTDGVIKSFEERDFKTYTSYMCAYMVIITICDIRDIEEADSSIDTIRQMTGME